MAADEVELLSFWASPYVHRVKMALAVKGVTYTELPQELGPTSSKSDLLLRCNPVYKTVPVMLHRGKALCESMVIVGYVDEAFPGVRLLPEDPFRRSVARFWAHFCDEKVFGTARKLLIPGEQQKAEAEELKQHLRTLEEGALGVGEEGPFFGGAEVGMVDLVLAPIIPWLLALESLAGTRLLDADGLPRLHTWMDAIGRVPELAACLPNNHDILEYARALPQRPA